MVNIWTKELGRRSFLIWLMLIFLSFVPRVDAQEKAVKYKKQTVVDFEDALIEGKSRKPYSAYLSKQKDEEMRGLFDWDLDWKRRVRLSADGAKHRK